MFISTTFLNFFYYAIKPYLPLSLRIPLRCWHAKHQRNRNSDIWPILESAGTLPPNWPGWPEGKQFAFILTHDVESQVGVDNVKALAKLEMSLGFRSSFYFVPEGNYVVPSDLRHWLMNNGFEVGVHDLHHDGKLFSSRKIFLENVKTINRYLKEWKAVGFRSGYMLRRLDWLHNMDILYDASSFDTDPFEPQPDGVNTIFPFTIFAPSAKKQTPNIEPIIASSASRSLPLFSYVELPYTLVQDSTLFIFLREQKCKIWETKLHWIANKGGMALLIVHPDYLNFSTIDDSVKKSYSYLHYKKFLENVSMHYKGQYFHALPREIAAIQPVHS